ADDPSAKRVELMSEYKEKFLNPYVAASYGLVDDIIDPDNTRIELIRSIEMNMRKREDRPMKKHGNIPL
ncbi:MAG: carboxyl transferase domain-containing protein, partial [Spirochaetales bacterium]|nr:carboxyl transferase domain-containing protein [Spirochaetales bacterium]